VDLDARIATQQARVDSGRRLLAQAKSLNDLVMLEREVATREADLAALQAKKRRLADLTALSTITAVLLDPHAAAPVAEGAPGFLAGLENGWKGLLASLGVLLTVIGWLLPWLIALGLPVWAAIWAYRRYRRNRPVRVPAPGIPAYAAAGPPPGYRPYPPAAPPIPQPAPPAAQATPQSAPPAAQATPQSAPPADQAASAAQAGPPTSRPAPQAAQPAPAEPAGQDGEDPRTD
jgi:hypothetical protein